VREPFAYERRSAVVSRPGVINKFLALFDAPSYLEIGVSEGKTFFAVNAQRKVAVDPKFRFSVDQATKENACCSFHEVASDIYFSDRIRPSEVFQVIFLDGLHTFEQTLRDFTNAIRFLTPDGVIIIDDIVPNSYQSGLPDQLDSMKVKEFIGDLDHSWMGDTYKLVFFIEAFFPTFELRTIADNHGQGVVWRSNSVRRDIKIYSAKEIADLQFLDIIKQHDIFRKRPCAEIVEEFKSVRRVEEAISSK
jgi:SAM-dependent methyltransferase